MFLRELGKSYRLEVYPRWVPSLLYAVRALVWLLPWGPHEAPPTPESTGPQTSERSLILLGQLPALPVQTKTA